MVNGIRSRHIYCTGHHLQPATAQYVVLSLLEVRDCLSMAMAKAKASTAINQGCAD